VVLRESAGPELSNLVRCSSEHLVVARPCCGRSRLCFEPLTSVEVVKQRVARQESVNSWLESCLATPVVNPRWSPRKARGGVQGPSFDGSVELGGSNTS